MVGHLIGRFREWWLHRWVRTEHPYVSTACWHAQRKPDVYSHERCRTTCKFCATPCRCACHAGLTFREQVEADRDEPMTVHPDQTGLKSDVLEQRLPRDLNPWAGLAVALHSHRCDEPCTALCSAYAPLSAAEKERVLGWLEREG